MTRRRAATTLLQEWFPAQEIDRFDTLLVGAPSACTEPQLVKPSRARHPGECGTVFAIGDAVSIVVFPANLQRTVYDESITVVGTGGSCC